MDKYIHKQLGRLQGKEQTEMVKKLAQHYNCSVATIWRKANAMGIRARGERSDKGSTQVDESTLELIASLVATSRRKNDKYTFDVKEVLEYLKNDLGIVVDVSYSRVCDLLNERGLTVEQFKKATPHIQVISEHPNQLHQFDVSICLQWYFDDKKKEFKSQTTHEKYYSNKLEDTVKKELIDKPKLHRYMLVDHCSGAFFFWYYYAKGENAVDGADFLFKSWSSKKQLINQHLNIDDYNGGYLFQGIPKILYTDCGAILRKQELLNLLKSLNVDVQFHTPGTPRAKGMVEGLMNIVEKGFESMLKIKGIKSIEELNAHALKWCIERNARQQFRGQKISRSALWRKIQEHQFIKCPTYDVWARLLVPNDVTRKVNGNGQISYEGNTYTVTNSELMNATVIVKPNAYEYPNIDVHYNGEVYILEPNTIDEYGRNISKNSTKVGEHKAMKKTSIQKFKERAEEVMAETHNTTFEGKGNKRTMKPPKEPAQQAELETDNIHVMEPASVQPKVEVSKPATTAKRKDVKAKKEEQLVPLSELIRVYIEEYGRLKPVERNKLVELYPTGVPMSVTATDIYNMLNASKAEVVKLQA